MVSAFSLEKVNKSGAVFNTEKLDWLNGQYIRKKSAEEIAKLAIPILVRSGLLTPAFESGEVNPDMTGYLGKAIIEKFKAKESEGLISFSDLVKVIATHQDKVRRLDELPAEIEYVYSKIKYDPQILIWKKTKPSETAENLGKLLAAIEKIKEKKWTTETIEKEVKKFITENNFGNGDILFPMRAALTGKTASPGPFAVAEIIGRNKSIERIRQAIDLLEK